MHIYPKQHDNEVTLAATCSVLPKPGLCAGYEQDPFMTRDVTGHCSSFSPVFTLKRKPKFLCWASRC